MSSSYAEEIRTLVQAEGARLRGISATGTAAPRAPGKWSRREVVGHLIDSAVNNHQRFVRAQLADTLDFPGYTQNEWVSCQGYVEEDWAELVALWIAVNRHIAHVVERIPQAKLSVPCRIGAGEPLALDALVADYLRHVRHHLEQV